MPTPSSNVPSPPYSPSPLGRTLERRISRVTTHRLSIRSAGRIGCAALALAHALPVSGKEPVVPDERGAAITEEVRRQTAGFGSLTARLDMTLENRRGQTSARAMRFRLVEREGGGTYSLCLVDAPADVRGTALLSHSHPDAENDQWLYMPAVQRTRRIAASGRMGAFMGSEFSYEDLSGRPLDRHDATWLHDDVYEGVPCHVVEYVSRDPRETGYTRQVAWIDAAAFRLQKVDYYNRRGELFKTLTLLDYRLYEDRFWHAARMEMGNHLTGNRTTLVWSDVVFGADLEAGDFDRQRLPHLR